MLRFSTISLLIASTAAVSEGHFVFIVPDTKAHSAKVILSEELELDSGVPAPALAKAKLSYTDEAGHEQPLKVTRSDSGDTVDLPAVHGGVVHGTADFGVYQHGASRASLLSYYPKTLLGNPFAGRTRRVPPAAVDLALFGAPGHFGFEFTVDGKPASGATMEVIQPGGEHQTVATDAGGRSPVFAAPGRYGVWARDVEPDAGDRDGKHYVQSLRYATLVTDVPTSSASTLPAEAKSKVSSNVTPFIPLPRAASSFGAVACDGSLYVYGGHIADTHSYSTTSVSGEFYRLDLARPTQWDTLAGGPPLQGMNLATWEGKIYRVGGMQPRNAAGQPDDVRSVADVACFDPATGTWTPMPALPEPRSSHDVVVIDGTLYVVGGWTLTGNPDTAKWADTGLSLDLRSPKARWLKIAQPFHRRALIAAVQNQKLYTLGGFQSEAEPSLAVDVFEPATGKWGVGPALPGPDINGFGPAACTSHGRLYVSVADGSVYRLTSGGNGWEKIAQATPRIVHRLVPDGDRLLVIGGAAHQKQQSLIQAVAVTP